MLEFVLGLAAGLTLFAWQRIHFSRQLQQLLSHFDEENLPLYLSKMSRLTMAAAQQRRRQQELQDLLSSVQQLINHAPLAYLQVDRDNHLLWCNQEASRLVEIEDPRPVTPRLLLEQVRSYDLDQLIETTRRTQRMQQRQWVVHPLKADPFNPVTRNSLYLMGHAIPLPDEQVGVFLENRQEIVKLAQQRDRWVSDVAHELKTPLTSIRLVAEMLETRVSEELNPWVQRLLGEVIHLSNLVHDLLDMSRLERRSAQMLKLAPTDVPELVQRAWNSLEPIHTSKRIRFHYVGPAALQIEADQNRLYRVLINLLDNAVKYSPAASTVQIRLAIAPRNPDYISLEVIDTGPGFPENSLDQVFERFYRADPARTRLLDIPSTSTLSPPDAAESSLDLPMDPSSFGLSPSVSAAASADSPAALPPPSQENEPISPTALNSCGLGLAIVRQIVEAHAGQVSARNHPETQGAWLRVTLPIAQPSR